MTKRTYSILGTKSSLLWDEDTDAWVYIDGKPQTKEDPRSYYKIIPTLYRAVDKRAKAISTLPWVLKRGDTEVDTSTDYQNFAGLVSSMNTMLWLIEASLTLAGMSYWKREQNPAGYDKLRHLDPNSLTLVEESARTGELRWKRTANNKTVEYTTKEIIYLWYPDPYVEIGPPQASPVQAALNACGVLANIDEFAKSYFGRGAIKAMLFAMQGASKADADAFETWWNKFISGIKNAFRTKVINAEKVTPVVVGEGIKELENNTISEEKRQEIAMALDIGYSLLFSNSANYATAERDKLNWYEDFVVPEANFIAAELNEQVYDPMGLHLEFKPETLDIFQEDENERAAAMSQFMDAIDKAGSVEMAKALFIVYGVEVDEEAMKLIEQHFANKKAEADKIQENIQNAPPAQPVPNAPVEPKEEQPAQDVKHVDPQQLGRELSIWQSKCLSALKRGEEASSIAFVPVHIPGETYSVIEASLKSATTTEDVKAAFSGAVVKGDEPQKAIDSLSLLAAELRRANDLLEKESVSNVIP